MTARVTRSSANQVAPIEFGDVAIQPGERRRLDLLIGRLPTHTPLHMPLIVVHSKRPGPRLWVNAAIHGDELNGTEIIRIALDRVGDRLSRGTLIAVPIVNVISFIQQTRYLPDRRDLNRSFPGSTRGSLAARLAHQFMNQIVARCTHGLDLHTASLEKTNYPQVRGNLRDPETNRLARAFNAPVIMQSIVRNGSLRDAATRRGVPIIVYEAGEPQRFNPLAIEIGVNGVMGVLKALGMIDFPIERNRRRPMIIQSSTWIRARGGGLLRLTVEEGQSVKAGQELGTIADPFGEHATPVTAPFAGLIIGRTENPVIHDGDAIIHLGQPG
ncbi:MAG: succinylglutamate desuccinylase/aspartoacylase family protein [Phycisphaerales bacterium]|nr:succinylglutamate desuccinylase/aspartoacylase family protein [Phycisphaerales bacterium]